MRITRAISAFITAEPETSLPKKTAFVLLPRATIGVTTLLAVTAVTADGLGPLPQQLAQTLMEHADTHDKIDTQTAINAGVCMYAVENVAMSILERLMKPLIDAGETRGIERGIEQGEARARAQAQEEFEAWKQSQRRKGTQFVEDDPEQEDPSK